LPLRAPRRSSRPRRRSTRSAASCRGASARTALHCPRQQSCDARRPRGAARARAPRVRRRAPPPRVPHAVAALRRAPRDGCTADVRRTARMPPRCFACCQCSARSTAMSGTLCRRSALRVAPPAGGAATDAVCNAPTASHRGGATPSPRPPRARTHRTAEGEATARLHETRSAHTALWCRPRTRLSCTCACQTGWLRRRRASASATGARETGRLGGGGGGGGATLKKKPRSSHFRQPWFVAAGGGATSPPPYKCSKRSNRPRQTPIQIRQIDTHGHGPQWHVIARRTASTNN
jgi:hypothetical protein